MTSLKKVYDDLFFGLVCSWKAQEYLVKSGQWLGYWLILLGSSILHIPWLIYAFSGDCSYMAVVWPNAAFAGLANLILTARYGGFAKLHSACHLPFLCNMLIHQLSKAICGCYTGGICEKSSIAWGLATFLLVVVVLCTLRDGYDAYLWFWKEDKSIIQAGEIPTGSSYFLQNLRGGLLRVGLQMEKEKMETKVGAMKTDIMANYAGYSDNVAAQEELPGGMQSLDDIQKLD